MLEERYKAHQKDGYSGLNGGFQEEWDFLKETAAKVMPDDHWMRKPMEYVLRRVSYNAQWPWNYKVRAVQRAAHLLMQSEWGAPK
jgi:hypothetical protein